MPLYVNSDLRNNGRELKSIAAFIFAPSEEKTREKGDFATQKHTHLLKIPTCNP
jgi:hypothetical protein